MKRVPLLDAVFTAG